MPAVAQVSEEEYLGSTYEPDSEYVDGALVERNAGTREHSRLQGALTAYFFRRRKRWNIHVYPEVRVRTSRGNYLLPDLGIVAGPEPSARVLTAPPLVCTVQPA